MTIKKKNRKLPAKQKRRSEGASKKQKLKIKEGWQEENNNWLRFYEHNKPVTNWKNPAKVVLSNKDEID